MEYHIRSGNLYIFFTFAKVRRVRTKVTDTDTNTQTDMHTHTHRETDKPIAIDEILHICLRI